MLKLMRCFLPLFFLTACSYNPFSASSQHTLTGSATGTAVGAVAGTSTGLLFGLPHSVSAALGIGGGAVGYYTTTQRFAAGGIIQSGGQVYSLGDYTTIEIPTDSLFESNSIDFLPGYEPTLLSVLSVLKRYPDNNILISGNTSGFGSAKYERKLSEERARQIANFLWANSINSLKGTPLGFKVRQLRYVGYGNYFPIANNIKAESIRQNSRIQITSYPPKDQLYIDKKMEAFNNIGGMDEPLPQPIQTARIDNEFPTGDVLPEQAVSENNLNDAFKEASPPAVISANPPHSSDYYHERSDLKGDEAVWGNYNSVASSAQTREGGSVAKQGGYKDETGRSVQGGLRGYKDETG
jgi:outer membrane protein OmpA-like peptidoglycan-associated protein